MLRPLREADAAAVADLFGEVYGADRDLDADEIRAWLNNEALDQDLLRVVEVGGEVVGYGDVVVTDDDVEVDLAAPGHEEVVFGWAEATAKERGLKRVIVVVTEGHAAGRILERRGYRNWRSSYRMERDIHDVVPPEVPDGFVFGDLRLEEAEVVRRVRNEVFQDAPMDHAVSEKEFHENNLKARGFDPSLWTLAWDGDELAGFVSALPQTEGNLELGAVAELGVRAQWRRRGLGEALLLTAFSDLSSHGLERVRLGVDAENIAGALRLYERVGMTQVACWNNWTLAIDKTATTV